MRNNLYKFFDKTGSSLNLSENIYTTDKLKNIPSKSYTTLSGSIYFPKISTGLIESEQIFLLQELIKDTSSFRLSSLKGHVAMNTGDTRLYGTNTKFLSELNVGQVLVIKNRDYIIEDIQDDTTIVLNNVPGSPFSNELVYKKDFFYYSSPIKTDDCEKLNCEVVNSDDFFLYNIDYTDKLPWINKLDSLSIVPANINTTTLVGYDKPVYAQAETAPLNINIGFSSNSENVFNSLLKISKEKTYSSVLEVAPSLNDNQYYLVFSGSSVFDNINAESVINLIGNNNTIKLDIVDCRYSSGYSVLVVEYSNDINLLINGFNYESYTLLLKNIQIIASISLYAETESEDERFATLLSNFGKKIDFNDEYIFRDSDINELLPNFTILNQKRKELLLEGDNIYPYIGSYKALLNAINFFGYNDIRVKEYFLNVDVNNKDFNKYFQVQIARTPEERNKLSDIWAHLPSTTHKKTSTFGLFYDINKLSGNYDNEGIPEVIDAFDFTQDEVLIKLFGLKNVLQEKFLPLNAKIIDITGEGIYFRPISVNIWNDNLTHFEIDLGRKLNVDIYPSTESYISDVRIIDDYYRTKYLKQGIIGFIETNPLGELYGNSTITVEDISINNLGNYIGGKLQSYDDLKNNNFSFFPPSIASKNYNENLSFLRNIEDKENIVTGAPVLIEAMFDLNWDECKFSYDDISHKSISGDNYNLDIWNWDKIALGQNIEVQFKVSYLGDRHFIYDSGRSLIDDYTVEYTIGNSNIKRILDTVLLPYDGTYEVTVIFYDLHNISSINTQTYKVNTRELEITSLYKKVSTNLKISDLTDSWDDYDFSYTNNVVNDTLWEDANCTWDDYSSASVINQNLYTLSTDVAILDIDRSLENITVFKTSILDKADFVTFKRDTSDFILIDKEIPNSDFNRIQNTNNFIVNNFVENIKTASRVIITKDREYGNFATINSNVYYYLDVVSYDNNILTLKSDNILADEIDNFIHAGYNFYLTDGIFSGTYSIEIKTISSDSNGNTIIRFNDVNKELFYIDGNFKIEVNNYDINKALINSDYVLSKQIGNLDVEYDNTENDYNDLHIHGTVYNGFLIPFVKPNGMIKINEGTEFYFSDNEDINSTSDGLKLACDELIASKNTELNKFNYSVIPSVKLNVLDINNNILSCNINFNNGTGTFAGGSNPVNVLIPAIIKPIFNTYTDSHGNTLHDLINIEVVNAGAGYTSIPNIKITEPINGNNKAEITLGINNGSIIVTNFTSGVNYSIDSTIEIDKPENWFKNCNSIFVDDIWIQIKRINNMSFYFDAVTTKQSGNISVNQPLLPYKWHTQQFGKNSELFNYFYYSIHGTSKTPNQETTSYIRTENGVYGPWKNNKFITHTLSVNNDLIYNDYNVPFSVDDMFDRLKFNNYSYPFNDTDPIFKSDVLSKQSSQDSAYLTQDLFTWENTIVSSRSSEISKNTGVTFTYSGSIIPGKTDPLWSLYFEDKLISQTISKNMYWNFIEPGEYSVSLNLKDSNGNQYSISKKAFIKVK